MGRAKVIQEEAGVYRKMEPGETYAVWLGH
jgi:hypothetical protein